MDKYTNSHLSSLLPPFLWHLTFFEMLFLILLVWCSLKDGMVGITLMNNAEVSLTVVIDKVEIFVRISCPQFSRYILMKILFLHQVVVVVICLYTTSEV